MIVQTPIKQPCSNQSTCSPIFANYQETQQVRIDAEQMQHPLGLGQVNQDEQATDFITLSLKNTDMPTNKLMLATAQTAGFSLKQGYDLQLLSALLASYTSEFLHHRSINQFMGVYLGQDVAAKVLRGQMARGDVQHIEAAIWFSNIDSSDEVTNDYQAEKHIGDLNSYYHQLISLIESNGGQVLKFMGDGILAMFEGDQSCHLALEAAVESLKVNHPYKHSVSLHYGTFDFGNIGSEKRLDFTAVGPQIQLASKIQSLASHLDCALLGTDAFAEKVQGCLKPLGYYRLEGIKQLQQLHVLNSFKP